MIALVTLGACCSTTAAATAGIGVAAQTSGTTVETLLLNNWYLNVFQLVILWVALIAQEQLLVAYGIFFDPQAAPSESPAPDRFAFPKGLARLALLIGGITWSLSTLADWTHIAPAGAGAGEWFHWIVQQQVPALLAVAVALAPSGAAGWVRRHSARPEMLALRGLLLVAGISLVAWVPATAVGAGVVGWVNELLGILGASAGLGAVSVAPINGWGLVFHWGFQLLLLGIFAIAVAVRPTRVLGSLVPTAASRSARSATSHSPSPTDLPAIGAAASSPAEP
jgi:hypothetical protein